MHLRPAAAVLALVLAVAGCGRDDGGTTATPERRADDQRVADAALLTLADLPPGFVESADDDEEEDEEDPFDKCATDKDAELEAATTAEGEAPNFEHSDTFAFVGSYSAVLTDADMAHDGVELLTSEELWSCFKDAMEEDIRNDAEAGDLADFTVAAEDLTYFEIGDEVGAFRLTMSGKVQGQPLVVTVDFVAVRKDRTIGMYFFGGFEDGYPLEDQVTIVNKALARIP